MITQERHIFKDAKSYFNEKIDSFSEIYVDSFLLIGIDSPNTPLEEIRMTKNPSHSNLYYKRIINALKYINPFVICESFLGNTLDSSCEIYYLNNYQDIEDFYMVHRVYNWEGTSNTSCQVLKLSKGYAFDMNNHWL